MDMTPKPQSTKVKIGKWNYIKPKNSRTAKKKKKKSRVKRQPTEQEKIVANHMSDKQLISKIQKELLQLNSNKT